MVSNTSLSPAQSAVVAAGGAAVAVLVVVPELVVDEAAVLRVPLRLRALAQQPLKAAVDGVPVVEPVPVVDVARLPLKARNRLQRVCSS